MEWATDPRPEGMRSPWRTYRHALEATPVGATHRLVIQDDVQVCRAFVAAARRAISARPEHLISFYVGGYPQESARALFAACDRGEHWVQLPLRWICPALALVWPVEFIEPFLAYVDRQNWPERFRADDEIIARWLRIEHRPVLATVPSLVEHPDDVPSLIGRRASSGVDTNRIAACFIADDYDALEIDWS